MQSPLKATDRLDIEPFTASNLVKDWHLSPVVQVAGAPDNQ